MSASHPHSQETLVRRRTEGRGYLWALILSAVVYLAALALVGFGFFTVPGTDPVRQGGWFVAIALLFVTPAALVLLMLSSLFVAIFRKLGLRYLPGLVQALPAVVLVCGLIWLFVRWMFAPPE
jgi:hypothetical protein